MVVLKAAKTENKSSITDGSKSYAKNLNLEVIHRILQALRQQGPVKITNLAMCSRMNHVVCKKYVQSMCKFGWIEFLSLGSITMINLTEIGIKIETDLNYMVQT